MAAVGRLVLADPADPADPAALLALARREKVDLTVIGPEAVLDRGVGDLFADAGQPLVGPNRQGAALECSKVYAKHFMARHGIPTARFAVCETPQEAIDAIAAFGAPVVVKADGLAAGKGVVVAETREQAEGAVRMAMLDRQFGDAGARLVVEECLSGPEVSFFVLADGTRAVPLATAQDHKRIWDDDRGPNTGGMGAFAPSPLVPGPLADEVMRSVVQPVVDGMRAEGDPYRGFLYVSLMLTDAGPRVIEFNVRFGDPEAQVVMPLLEGRFARLLLASAKGDLAGESVRLVPGCAVGVVLASRGYPATSESGHEISGLARAEAMSGVLVFHAGTREVDGRIVTAGGRVLTVVGHAPDCAAAMTSAYAAVEAIGFDGMQYRRDIGRKAITGGPDQ
jgi:phosphoribosylamine---glycine ligase